MDLALKQASPPFAHRAVAAGRERQEVGLQRRLSALVLSLIWWVATNGIITNIKFKMLGVKITGSGVDVGEDRRRA